MSGRGINNIDDENNSNDIKNIDDYDNEDTISRYSLMLSQMNRRYGYLYCTFQ